MNRGAVLAAFTAGTHDGHYDNNASEPQKKAYVRGLAYTDQVFRVLGHNRHHLITELEDGRYEVEDGSRATLCGHVTVARTTTHGGLRRDRAVPFAGFQQQRGKWCESCLSALLDEVIEVRDTQEQVNAVTSSDD